ncbi:MFS transporter, partial [Parvibaculum sp.]|uniref:MFS transporter n=1 Tax=Parvibaculum sp. TaxID=2024848 RepID=UPI002C09CF85
PISLLAFAISRSLPGTRRATHRFDWGSAALNAIAFALLITIIDDIGHGTRNLPRIGVEAVALLVCGVWLVRRQLAEKAPLLPIDLLRIPIFALSICTSILSFAGQMLAFVALPFYLQNQLGRNEVETGLLLTPWPIVLMIVGPLSGRLADRYPAGLLGAIGMALFAGGLFALALLPPDPGSFDIVWRMMLCGAGFGLFQSPNNRTLIGSAPIERTGGASGMLGTARLLGQTVGAALVALIFNLHAGQGTRIVLFTAAGFALAAMVMSSLRLTGTARGGRE